jgi:hypothetical protein
MWQGFFLNFMLGLLFFSLVNLFFLLFLLYKLV